MLTTLKEALFGDRPTVRRPPFGLYRGLRIELDLRNQSQLFLGVAEIETHSWLRRRSKLSRTLIDVGAGMGELALYFLKRTKVERVYAFEPMEQSRHTLRGNLALNGFTDDSRIVVSNKFVGSVDNCMSIRLDTLLPEVDFPALVKVDVDGAELDVLQGSLRLLQSRMASWLIETHSRDLEIACVKLFRDAGYETHIIPTGWYRKLLSETRPIPHNRWFTAEAV